MNKKFLVLLSILVPLLGSAENSKDFWSGADYNKNSEEQKAAARKTLETLALTGSEKVLDIGCGDGYLTSLISSQVPNGSVVGIDLSPSMISFASEHFKRESLSFRVLDAQSLDYENQFDLVVSFTTLHWIPDQLPVLKGIERALKSGGKVIIDIPSALPKPMVQAVEETMAKKEWAAFFYQFSPGWRFFTADEYQDLLDESGLQVSKILQVEVPHAFPTRSAFTGFLKQWFPYLRPLPESKKGAFLEQVAARYLELVSPDKEGRPRFVVNRLRIEAEKF